MCRFSLLQIVSSDDISGLRGRMEAGWSRMNGSSARAFPLNTQTLTQILKILSSSKLHRYLQPGYTDIPSIQPCFKGLAEYVLKNVEQPKQRGIVIGHDHRYHSEHWAELTALVFATRGMKVNFLRGLNHTPMCV